MRLVQNEDIIAPVFIRSGEKIAREVPSMPGIFQFSVDRAIDDLRPMVGAGLRAILLFGIPDHKDAIGSAAETTLTAAIGELRRTFPDLRIMTDVCLCAYTDHGHCAPLDAAGRIDGDAAVFRYADIALSHAKAGAHIVAPSGMMDRQVAAIRSRLDGAGFSETGIMAYSAKFASSFYGPFRDAAESAPKFGDRTSYQIDPADRARALREIETDIAEGAEIVMVKPALAYLDIIREARDRFELPIAAYNVSGEYAMLKPLGTEAMNECLTAIKRAGADLIITYFAKEFFIRNAGR